MPSRPHLPARLSLHRGKSANSVPTTSSLSSSSTPLATPSAASRNDSPGRRSIKASSSNGNLAGMPQLTKSNSDLRGDHKGMSMVLRVQVIKGRNLAPKDKSGTSDPFLVLTLGDAKEATSVMSKTLNPEWNQTFELPVNSPDSALLEAVCWDKDRFKKDYMGEFDVVLEDVFGSGVTSPEPIWCRLESRRSGRRKKKDTNVSGEVLLKFTLSDPLNPTATAQQTIQRLAGIVVDPADDDDEEDDEDELLRRIGSTELDDVDEEDDEKEPSDETDDGTMTPAGTPDEKQKHRRRRKLRKLRRRTKQKAYEFGAMSDVAGVLFLEINRITDLPPEKNMTKTTFDMDPFVVTSLGKKTYRTRVVNHNLNPVFDEKLVFQVQKHETNFSLYFAVVDRDKFSGNDFVGTANFSLEKVRELAPEADPETGLYRLPDPDSVMEGEQRRKRFRNPMSRSSSQTNLPKTSSKRSSQTDLNKLTSSNALSTSPRPALQQTYSELSTVDRSRPVPTSMPSAMSINSTCNDDYPADEAGLKSFEIPLELKKKDRWESKHNPTLYIRAKYLPYKALRQQFWRVLLRQYDSNDNGMIDKVELSTMLDTLGSTLHDRTIDGFFRRFRDVNGEEILTADQAVICLEEQLMKNQESHHHHLSSSLSKLKRESSSPSSPDVVSVPNSSADRSPVPGTPQRDTSQIPSNLIPGSKTIPTLEVSKMGEAGERGDYLTTDDAVGLDDDVEEDLNAGKEEHVVEIQECPICHQPRIARGRKTTDADIITHIATCASSDWRAVNNLVMAGFVSSSQAQRKWYSKVISKVSYGGYRIGANSANILVQDRQTGMINEERMSVYVRLGIRLLYKGLKSREMEKKRARKLLRSLSFKQGRKYDDPSSASQIPGFINFHQLDMNEVRLPLNQFKTFNQFFYRELKPGARPCSAPNDPHIVVSPADCRSVVFNRLEDAQRIWVKGREFSVERLLGDAYPKDAKRYQNGALGIMRLAPQDYHRFHIPVDGVMDEPKLIDGEYYTVNPMAIRSALDVYGENIRVCVPIDSVCHGRVMVICVGAMMVGSTVITRKKGENVKRAEELGYFKFGGSTILLLFEPGVIKFDEDLADNSTGALETLIRVGMSIGRTTGHAPHTADMQKTNPTESEKEQGKRRIEGSLAPSSGAKVV
ncbi:phosphatidylserine decarboxylase like protein [Zymoseptoria brevis]|uniref:Phosphatidylserine decarboxylase proenzyme 2 n=1 Tax=Zymoseptoria brevis TaxID=1047168 RepID=A0A0F4GNI9_9PEZI|nr:phosphatidylserine decarboxylase like protein [Zymoseptoria brevis]